MVKTLTKHGNSYAVILDKPVLDLLNITAETPLNISTDVRVITLAPVQDVITDDEFRDAVRFTKKRFGKALKRLAE